ncbi:MAG: hypothetical protein A3H29_13250 [Acidobacteria bacterium RIFCSPLOWO2_02_FULL_67_21]|nr:MAG: hypothetical protein A3H29_13250 [Acidobacteria bacterium RIFCSPLOWO2_02_FULL_67_21]
MACALIFAQAGSPSSALAQASTAAQAAPAARRTAAAPIDYATAHLERRLPAVRAAGSITLDGRLDEPAWLDAPMATNFIQNDPREGDPATFDTEVRVLYDDEALYFGIFARDDEPGRIIVSDIDKDFDTNRSDGFRIALDTFHDQRNGYQFATNPAGAKWDAQMANEGRENNVNWDGIWDVTTTVGETGWTAEIRIPFRTLKFTNSDIQTWGVNFERKIRRLNEDSYWSPLPRIYDLQRVSLAGSVDGLRGLRPGMNLRVKPSAVTSSNTVGGAKATGDFDMGVDVKYGVTSGLVWDFTVNTDFSQVEADEQQINLTRFSLLFPEKRDFFLENSGIFQFGGSGRGGGGGGGGGRQNAPQEMQLFFSRNIGLSNDGNAIPILAGSRLSGRQGPVSIGILNIQQRELGNAPATNFTALRVRRDILAQSDIGAIFLNKDASGPNFNRVAGFDANFRFGFLNLTGYAANTFSPDSAVAAGGDTYVTRVGFDYNNRDWQAQLSSSNIGSNFNDELGFVPRRGVGTLNGVFGTRWRPQALSKVVREAYIHWHLDQFTRHLDDAVESRYQGYHWMSRFQDGSNAEIGVNTNVEDILAPFTINRSLGTRITPGRYEFSEFFGLWNTNNSAPVSVSSRYSNGRFYDGYRRGYSIGPAFRLNENLNASVSLQLNDIDVATGSFVSKLLSTRINYNFNTKMFFNGLLQYNSDNHQWTSNLRFNIIHRPLSDFFLVYNEQRDERTGDMLSRAVIAKMTYLVAF